MGTFGVHGFVAHDSIEPTLEWQEQIEKALRTADVLVGLLHEGASVSAWVQQEVGWAHGRGCPVLMIKIDEHPRGFSAKTQAAAMARATPLQVATYVAGWLNRQPGLSARLGDGVIEGLRGAGSYMEARDFAQRLEGLGTLSAGQLDALEDVFRVNDQVHGSIIASPIVKRILAAHGRQTSV